VLERLKHNFRLLLGAFDGVVCPLWEVRTSLETPEVERLHAKGDLNAALCASHLGSYFGCTDDRSTRARVTRRIIETIIAGRPACQVCEHLSCVEGRLARAIRRLDHRMRFRKALEMASLFCQPSSPAVRSARACSVCTAVVRAVFDHLSRLQYELSVEDDAQRDHAETGGFCPAHTWLYANMTSPLGAAGSWTAWRTTCVAMRSSATQFDGI